MEISKYIETTFQIADGDIYMANVLLNDGASPNGVCFHCQQAAEKYLKGFISAHGKDPGKIHDLKTLIIRCRNIDPSFTEINDDAVLLNRFYTETRYAEDFHAFSLDEAKGAIASALRIKEFVLSKIQ
jgi:HEPN domain-containing protein